MRKYFLGFVCLFCLSTSTHAHPPVYVNSLEEAVVLQKQIDHDILLIFSSNKCSYCEILKKDLENMNIENKIICIIDIENNQKLKIENNVSIIPDTRIISKGKQIKKIIGYKNKTKYLDNLK